jgi:acetyl esterase
MISNTLQLHNLDEVHAVNARLADMPHPDVRTAEGLAALRSTDFSSAVDAYKIAPSEVTIPSPGGEIRLRIFEPPRPARAAMLNIHGGGFCIGSPEEDDRENHLLAAEHGIAVISPDYRLAPEHVQPAGIDDCVAAGLWLAENAPERFGTTRILVGGGSAGGLLAAHALLALRDAGYGSRLTAASFVFGVFDLGGTASSLAATNQTLVLTRDWQDAFHDLAFPGMTRDQLRSPTVSPMYGDLSNLPPALFTVGDLDPLVDDSREFAARWAAAGNDAVLDVYPGAVHGFCNIYPESGHQAVLRVAYWLSSQIEV